nr:MAG TPA: DNA-directed RNA polymerase subunit beta [Caudoviricetes sp.]
MQLSRFPYRYSLAFRICIPYNKDESFYKGSSLDALSAKTWEHLF